MKITPAALIALLSFFSSSMLMSKIPLEQFNNNFFLLNSSDHDLAVEMTFNDGKGVVTKLTALKGQKLKLDPISTIKTLTIKKIGSNIFHQTHKIDIPQAYNLYSKFEYYVNPYNSLPGQETKDIGSAQGVLVTVEDDTKIGVKIGVRITMDYYYQ